MRKTFFLLVSALVLSALPAIADEAALPVPEPVTVEQPAEPVPQEPAVNEELPAVESSSESTEARSETVNPLATDPFQNLTLTAGQSCGSATCGKFEYCCNPTCNLCVPFGMSCTQEVCNYD